MANLCSAISDIQLAGSQRQGSTPRSPAGLHSETPIPTQPKKLSKGLDYRIDEVSIENEVEGREQSSHRYRSFATPVPIEQSGSDDPST